MKFLNFWTDKRLEALSKVSLNLFQAFVIATVAGGLLGKFDSLWTKVTFVLTAFLLLSIGILLADRPKKNNKKNKEQ